MLSKNNYNEKLRKMSARKERFSIRKFAVGAASVMIGLTLFGVGSQTVKADTTVTTQNNSGASNGNEQSVAKNDTDESADATNNTEQPVEAKANESEAQSGSTVVKEKTKSANPQDETYTLSATDITHAPSSDLADSKATGSAENVAGTESDENENTTVAPQTEDNWVNEVSNWNYTKNDDGTITIDGYKDTAPVTTDYYIPNSADFRLAKDSDGNYILAADKQANIASTTLHSLVTDGKATSITVHSAAKGSGDGVLVKDKTLWETFNGYNSQTQSYDDTSLKSLALGGLDTTGVTDLAHAFRNNSNLVSITGLENWDTSSVGITGGTTGLGNTFSNDPKLTTISDISDWDTSNVNYMDWTFGYDKSLTNIDVSKWNFSKVKWLTGMFDGTSNLTYIGNLIDKDFSAAIRFNSMFNESGIASLDMSGSKFNTTSTPNVDDMFANLVNPATITLNSLENTPNFAAKDFAGNQPLIVISDNTNIQALNNNGGHAANTVTFQDGDGNTVATQQQNFVFDDNSALSDTLTAIPTIANLKNVKVDADVNSETPALGDVITSDATWKSGWTDSNTNAAQPNTYGQDTDYGKIAGTYAVTAQTEDVTKSEIDDGSYPDADKKTATYNVVERFPDTYTGEGTMSATDYATAIGDTEHESNYEGYVYKIIANQTVTAYETATKNLVTGAVTYSTPYNSKYLDFSTTTDNDVNGQPLWDHKYSDQDKTYIGSAPVDTPAGYTISANPQSYTTGLKDNRNPGIEMLQISYNPTAHTFHYDFMNSTSDANAHDNITFNTLPDSYNFYIDYTKDPSVTYQFVDTQDNGAVVGTQAFTKPDNGDTVDVSLTIPDNYVLDDSAYTEENGSINTSYKFTSDQNQTIQIKLKHKTQDVTQQLITNGDYPDQVEVDGKEVQTKATATYQIIEEAPASHGGTKTLIKQVVTARKIATQDLVTGEITYSKDYSMKYTTVENSGTEAGKFSATDDTTAYNIPYDESFPGYTTHLFEDYSSPEKGTNGSVTSGSNYNVLHVYFGTSQDGKSVINYDFMVGGSRDVPTFNALPASRDFVISYTADPQSETITFKDEDGNTVGTPITVSGHTGDTSVETNASVPAGWTLANDNETVPTTVDFTYDGDTPNFKDETITIKHNTITLTPDQVKAGNLPDGTVTSDTYPTPGKVPTDATDVTKTVTRTINVTKPGETKPTTTEQKANFTRNVTIDLVDGTSSYGDWTGSDKWDAYEIPTVAGYTPQVDGKDASNITVNDKEVPGISEVTPAATDGNVTVNVTYSPQSHTSTITFKDSKGNTIGTPVDVTGYTGTTSTVDINSKVPAGWKLSNGQPSSKDISFTYGEDGQPTFEKNYDITIEHNLIPVTPEDSGKPLPDGTKTSQEYKDDNGDNYPSGVTQHDVEQDITRTITVVKPDGTSTTETQTAKFTRPMYVDLVTGSTVSGDWTLANGWDAYRVTDIPGYTTHITQDGKALDSIEADKPADVNSPDQAITVTYTANEQNGKISYTYTDEDGKTTEVGTTPLTGQTGDTVPINPVAPDGYEIVPDQDTPTTEKATDDGIPDVTVKVVPATIKVTPDQPKNEGTDLPDGTKTSGDYPTPGKYPAGVSENDLNKTVTRKINVTDPTTGKTTTTTQEVKFTRTATINLADGSVSYTDWAVDGTDTLPAYTAPEIPGYTADKTVSEIDNVPEDGSYADVNISYTAKPQTGKISYVDESGKEVGTTPLSGNTGEDVSINPVAPDGYEIVPNQGTPTSEKATADGIPAVTVKVVPATIKVTPDKPVNPGTDLPEGTKTSDKYPTPGKYPAGVSENDLNKTVTRTINVTDPTTGKTTKITQEVKFTRTATINLVDGSVSYTDWTTTDSTLPEYSAPEVPGYTADGKAEEITGVKDSDKFDDVNITYTANPQSTQIIYQDENGNQIGDPTTVTGVTNETIDPSKYVKVPAGYEITGTVPTSYTFKADDNGNIIVTVAAIPPYVPEPDDGDVTVIVNYKDKDGNIISSETITGKPGETITVGTNIPAGGGVVDIAVTKNEEKPAKGDESKPDETKPDNIKTDTDVTSEPEKKQAKHKKAKKTSNYSSNTGVKGAGLDHESNIGAKGTDLNKGPKATGTESATAPKGEYMKSNDKALPQTGEDDTKAAGLLGTILAAMGITTAFGAKKRRKQD